MANHKSTKKRIVVTARQTRENRTVKSALKTQYKKLDLAVETADENLEEISKITLSAIDKAAAKGVMHKNAANRKKAQVAKKVANA